MKSALLDGDGTEVLLRAFANLFSEAAGPATKSQAGGAGTRDGGPDLQDRFRALVEQIPAVVFMAPLDGGIGEAYVSPQIEQAVGFTQEEWLADPVLWYKQIHPDDKVRWSAEAAEMLMTGRALKSTYRVLSRDRRVIWLHCEARMMRATDGRPWFIHGVGFDITGLKQTEEALHEERNFVTAILDTVRALVVVLDAEGHIIRCNRACEQITGYSLAEVKNRYVWDIFVVPEESQQFQTILRQARKDQQAHEYESQWLTREGQHRVIAWSSTILSGPHETATYTILTGIDITRRKQLEKRELERQAAKTDETLDLLQRLIDSMSEALILVDVSGYAIRTNHAATVLLQCEGKHITGQRTSDLLTNPAIPLTPSELLARDPRGRLYIETELLLGSGNNIPVTVSCAVVNDRAGNITGLLLVIRDIAERRQAEEARLQLAAIVESSDDAIIGIDLNGIITSWNAGAERLFDYAAGEIIRKPVLALIPPELRNEEPALLRKLLAGERIQHYESQRVTKRGKRVDVSLTISPVKNAADKLVGASMIARDIGGRRQAEEMLRRTEKLATAGRLAASIAHEINNPLEAVTNLLYLMRKHPSRVDEYLGLATQELDRVTHISKQTLGFYRDTSEPVLVNLTDILGNVLYLYARRLESREIKIKTEYDRELEIAVIEGEIRQVFSNLIANALDAMPHGGVLTLRVSRSRKWSDPCVPGVRISIGDTGSGIEREHMKKIFDAFYTTKTDVGTGLGLWVTQGIIKRHNGSIRFRSKTSPARSGTVFSVFLPKGGPREGFGVVQTAS